MVSCVDDRYASDRVVARIRGHDKRTGQRAAHHRDAQPAMRQRLVVMRDRRIGDHGAELLGELARRQLPQSAKQSLGTTTSQHDRAGLVDPHQRACEHRQLALLLARRDDRQLVDAAGPGRRTMHRDRADEAAR